MKMIIPANEHGKLYVFSVEGAVPPGLEQKTPDSLEAAFGTAGIDPAFVDVLTANALTGMTLSQYIATGYDMTAQGDAGLDGLQGHLVLVMSRAFGGRETTLDIAPPLRLVATLQDKATLTAPAPLRSDGATGVLSDTPKTKPVSQAAISGRVATIALLVLFALVALMIWIAG